MVQSRGVATPLTALLFGTPQKSKQKKAPELLALRLPFTPLHFAAKKKTRFQLKHFSSSPRKVSFLSGCVTRELVVQRQIFCYCCYSPSICREISLSNGRLISLSGVLGRNLVSRIASGRAISPLSSIICSLIDCSDSAL